MVSLELSGDTSLRLVDSVSITFNYTWGVKQRTEGPTYTSLGRSPR
jgi:hypothetical protein